MVGSMRSCVTDGQTDRQTDGAGYIGPAQGYGGSNNNVFFGPAHKY
jgi:hypothetical protein